MWSNILFYSRHIGLPLIALLLLAPAIFAQDVKKDLKKGWKAMKSLDGGTAEKYFELVVNNPKVELLSLDQQLELYSQLGWLYNGDEKYDEAVTAYKKVLSIEQTHLGNPTIPQDRIAGISAEQDLYFLGSAEMKLGRYSDAEEHLRKSLQLSETSARFDRDRIHQALGILYYRTKQYDLAVPNLIAFIALTGGQGHYQSSETHSILANIYRDQGKYAEAEDLYKRAIEMMEWYDAHASKHVKTFDDIRINNFIEYAKLLRLQKR